MAFFRSDQWVTDALGNAIAGAQVYVCSQPANTGHIDEDTGVYVPPSPLVPLYADSYGMRSITNPVQTNGYGHAFFYVAAGTYTITYWSPAIGQVTLPDQVISGIVAAISTAALSGDIDGVNRVFQLPSAPTNFQLVLLNGVAQLLGTDYTISSNVVTMTVAPSENSQLWALYQ